MRIGLISYNARQGDAIGNQVAEKIHFFRQRCAELRVFVHNGELLHPAVAPYCTVVEKKTAHAKHVDFLKSCDLVIAEYGQYYPLLDVLPLLNRHKPRIMIDYHGVTPPELWGRHNTENLARGVARRGLLWCADGVIVHSWFTYNELVHELGLPPDRILRWAYPVEIPAEARTSTERNWRQSLGLQDALVLLYVGRLAPNKNVPLLVEAMQHLRDVEPEVHLLIVGDDGDLYQVEADRCRQLAQQLDVGGRVHLLGPLVGERLYDAYRSADLFVTASAWESFCIPVVEAMAFGVPVVAARATALPDTVGDAGLTFAPGDAVELAKTIRRVATHSQPLSPEGRGEKKRIVVIDGYPGNATVSGITRSMTTIAGSLQRLDHEVTYFSVYEQKGNQKSKEKVIAKRDNLSVSCFPVASGNPGERQRLQDTIERCDGIVPPEMARAFLDQLPQSPDLMSALEQRIDEIDALIVGPYLSAISFAISRKWPEKTLLLPCLHDEKSAQFGIWRQVYKTVAGLLYHSEEEQILAQAERGINHPNGVMIGTFLPPAIWPELAPPFTKSDKRYLVYCGRFLAEKNVPLLLEYARRYCAAHPNRFDFVFVGEGPVPIPRELWAKNMGIMGDEEKARILSGAAALISLSTNESLSMAVLEAWQLGTPVVVPSESAVMRGHVERSGGGAIIQDYAAFEKTLNDLWEKPQAWHQAGQHGQRYVQANYGDEKAFAERLNAVLVGMTAPLYELMRKKGFSRAEGFSRLAWSERFAKFVEQVMDREKNKTELLVEVRRRVSAKTVSVDSGRVLIPALVCNWGAGPALAEGPARVQLCAQVKEEATGKAMEVEVVPLPRQLFPGEKVSAVLAASVPQRPGQYTVTLWAESVLQDAAKNDHQRLTSSLTLTVTEDQTDEEGCCAALLENARLDLDEAGQLQRLPDDYLDLTQGTLAKVKRQIKHKLLNNFKVAYVDVLSHQQSAFNRQVLSVVEELLRCCETLDHAMQQLQRSQVRKRRKRKRQRQ